jgi:phospholipase/carboxylesterase
MELITKEFTHKFVQADIESKKVMIVMHGLGDSLDSYVPLVKELTVKNLNYLVINAPLDYPMGYSWYDLPPESPRTGIDLSCKKLMNLIIELEEQGIKQEDIFIMGFSQGGCITLELINKLNFQLAGAIALSPRVYVDSSNEKSYLFKTPLFVAHGQFDPVIPYSETADRIKSFQKINKNIIFKTYPMEHSICMDELNAVSAWLEKLV